MSHARAESKQSSSSPSSKKGSEERGDTPSSASSPARGPGLLRTAAPAVGLDAGDRSTQDGRRTQAKLTVNEPDDEYEREAERVAEAVMRMAAPEANSVRLHGTQHRAGGDGNQTVEGSTRQRIESLRGGGEPLPPDARSFFESRLGQNLSDVRVHVGPKANKAARSIDAKAFTYGSDIAFKNGAYAPDNLRGKKLLAHELAHVVQQDGPPGTLQRQPTGGAAAGAGLDTPGPANEIKSGGAIVTDILTVLDVGASIAELTPLMGQAAAGMVGMASAFGVGIFGLLDWASALNAQKNWAAVQGASYAVVSIAHGRSPPSSHGEFGSEAQTAWKEAAKRTKKILENRIDAGGEQRRSVLRTLKGIRKQSPDAALNRIYQYQVDQQLQDYFLGFIPAGGVSWDIAKQTALIWPGPAMVTGVSRDQIEKLLSKEDR